MIALAYAAWLDSSDCGYANAPESVWNDRTTLSVIGLPTASVTFCSDSDSVLRAGHAVRGVSVTAAPSTDTEYASSIGTPPPEAHTVLAFTLAADTGSLKFSTMGASSASSEVPSAGVADSSTGPVASSENVQVDACASGLPTRSVTPVDSDAE